MRFLPLVGALIGNVLHVRLPRRGIGRGGGRFFLTGFVTLFIVVFLVFFFRFLLALYGNLVIAGSFIRYPRPFPEIVFFTAFLVNLILLFFAAIPPATALFLKRKENEFFLNLPLSPVRMALARYTALFSVIFPLNLFLSLPAVFSYSRYYAFGLEFLPGLSAGLVVLPQIAVVLAVMFVVALRKLPRFSGFRPAAEIGVFVILFALLAAMQLVLQHALIDLGRDHGNIFLLELADFLSGTAEAVPPLKWAALSFTADDGWRSFLLFLLVGGALSALALLIAVRAYPGSAEPTPRRKGRPGRSTNLPALRGGIVSALVFREWKLFSSSPQTVFEISVRLLVLPAFLCIYAIAGPRDYIDLLYSFASSSPLVVIGLVAALLLLEDVSFLAATGLSRERHLAALSFSFPVSGAVQLKGKLVFTLLLTLPTAGVVVAVLYMLFPFPAESLVYTVPGVIVYQLSSFCIGSYLELKYGRRFPGQSGHPFLQNRTALTAFFLQTALVAAGGGIAFGLFVLGMNPLAVALLVIEALAVFDLAFLPRLFRYAERRYAFELETG